MPNLLSENEIIAKVQLDWTKPLVTFLCITYNQEDYIEQTIRGFLKQKTSFPYEILIHDDCSTDGTRDIIESYRLRYPHLIRCIYQTENKYSKGISPIVIAGKECRSEYVALCEGDDYWIDNNKIANQFNLIKNDSFITMVVSPSKLEQNGKMLSDLLGYYGDINKNIVVQDILNITGQFAPTASYLLKRTHLVNARDIFSKAPVGDIFIELYSAVFGKIVYFPEVGSVYRIAAKQSWSEAMSSNKISNQLKFVDSMKAAIDLSKTINGFESLDWSIKLSTMYYTLSIYYLQAKEYKSFSKAIEISYKYAVINNQQKTLFFMRDYMFLFYNTSRPLLFFRRKLKIVLGHF